MTEASGLASALASRLGTLWAADVEVTGLRPLPGGASRESWDVRVRTAGDAVGERHLILLRQATLAPPGPDTRTRTWPSRRRP